MLKTSSVVPSPNRPKARIAPGQSCSPWPRLHGTAEGSTRYAEVRAGSSFESSSDPRVYFGLGAATRVDAIVIRWPSGQVEKLGTESADQGLVVQEGRGVIVRNPGKKS